MRRFAAFVRAGGAEVAFIPVMERAGKRRGWDHRLFQIGVALKGFDGAVELIGGVLMFAYGPHGINRMLQKITQSDLVETPHNFFSHFLSQHLHLISTGSAHFAAFYLLFQGIIKLWLAEALLRERRWVFPVALVLMAAFEAYMAIHFAGHPGLGVAFLFTLNLIIIALIWREYSTLRNQPAEQAA